MPERLVELARTRIASGALPSSSPDKTFGGVSAGARCAVCREAIASKSLEIEAIFPGPSGASESVVMHPACYAAWSTAAHKPAT
jgi:hypothetical protein